MGAKHPNLSLNAGSNSIAFSLFKEHKPMLMPTRSPVEQRQDGIPEVRAT
jgi:hypothetical protein